MKLNATIKGIFSLLLRLGVSGGLLAYLFHKIDLQRTFDILKTTDFRFIYLAIAVFMVCNALILVRWYIYVRALKLPAPFIMVAKYFFIGTFFNIFLPSSTGGDIIKAIGLCGHTQEKAKVVASVVLDRLTGFLAIMSVAVVSFVLGYRILSDGSLIIPIAVMGAIPLAIILFLFNERLYSWACRIFGWWPSFKEKLMSLHYDIVLIKNERRAIVETFFLSCLSQVILAVDFYLVARALHVELSIVYFFIFVPITCVVSALPSIGGLGFRDAGAAYLFAKAGLSSGVAVSITLINFLFMVLIGLIGGIIYVTSLSSRWLQRAPSDA